MDIEEAKKFARNKIDSDAITKQVRDIIKITKWQKQDMREGFKETFKPLIKSQDSIKKSIDEQQNKTISQLQANQLALTQGLNQNRMAITEGFNKLDEVKRWDLSQLPGFEAIEDPPKEDDGVLPSTSDDGVLPSTSDDGSPKIAKFKPDDLNRFLNNKEAQDILKINEYHKLPSEYIDEDLSTIDKLIDDVNIDIEKFTKKLKNTADFVRDENGFYLAIPKSKKPREETLDNIKNYKILNIYATSLSNLKYYKTKIGSGMIYFNNPHQILKRLELLGASIIAGNNGVIPEFSKLAHLLKQMKVISNKQLNDLLKTYITIR